MSVDDRRRPFDIEIFDAADGGDAPADRNDCVRVENGAGNVAAQHQSDISDDEFCGRARTGGFFMGHAMLLAISMTSPAGSQGGAGEGAPRSKILDGRPNSFVCKQKNRRKAGS
jgi:hypothetical protein